jgi:hypothetical protein
VTALAVSPSDGICDVGDQTDSILQEALPLHERTVVDRFTGPTDLLGLAFKRAQIDGVEPFVRSFTIDRSLAPLSLIPAGLALERGAISAGNAVALARSSQGSLLISTFQRSTEVTVSARTDASAAAIVQAVMRRVPAQETAGTVSIRTWHRGYDGRPEGRDRRIDAPSWAEVGRNYPDQVRNALDRLTRVVRPGAPGKLILWHGDPGTGKTTALRALIRSWESWTAAQYIADPEQFFADPGYIAGVLGRPPAPRLGPTLERAGDPEALWRLVVAEDSDEYLRASARRDAGAGLGRLLNLADGVLGQGFNSLILLTTNEDIQRIHPALTRPGRCLARVEFARFTPEQARRWLPETVAAADSPATLAELFERRGDLQRIGDVDPAPHRGQYL